MALIRFIILFIIALAPCVQAASLGLWADPSLLSQLTKSGSAWNALINDANSELGNPTANLGDQDDDTGMATMAAGIVCAAGGNPAQPGNDYCAFVRDAIVDLYTDNPIATSDSTWDNLGAARTIIGYVIAADLIDLATYDASVDSTFRTWLAAARDADADPANGGGGDSLREGFETHPNNHGSMSMSSLIAIDLYLQDTTDLETGTTSEAVIEVAKAYFGESSTFTMAAGDFGDLFWQCDDYNPSAPSIVNPVGCVKTVSSVERDVDGAISEELRRSGCGSSHTWPISTGCPYPWEAMQGYSASAVLLHRAGYGALTWGDSSWKRAIDFLYRTEFTTGNWPAEGNDTWIPWLVKYYYPSYDIDRTTPVTDGRTISATDWTHSDEAKALDSGGTVIAPSISPTTINHYASVTVTVTDNDTSDNIFYTTDGSTPTCPSEDGTESTYSAPFAVSTDGSNTVQAIACIDADSSSITSQSYVVDAWTSTTSWKNVSIPDQAAPFTFTLEAIPSVSNLSSVTCFSNGTVDAYTDCAVIVRFSRQPADDEGDIDARDGSVYTTTGISYTGSVTYTFTGSIVEFTGHTYDVSVSPGGELCGGSCAFRTEQNTITSIDNLAFISNDGDTTIQNLTISPANVEVMFPGVNLSGVSCCVP